MAPASTNHGLIDENAFAPIAPASPFSPTPSHSSVDDKGTPTPAQRTPRPLDHAAKQARIDALTAQINEVRNSVSEPHTPTRPVGVAGSQHAPKRPETDPFAIPDGYKPSLRDGLEPGPHGTALLDTIAHAGNTIAEALRASEPPTYTAKGDGTQALPKRVENGHLKIPLTDVEMEEADSPADGFTLVTHKKRKLSSRDANSPPPPANDTPSIQSTRKATPRPLTTTLPITARSGTFTYHPLPQTIAPQGNQQTTGRTLRPSGGWAKRHEDVPCAFFKNVTDDTREAWLSTIGPCCLAAVYGKRADQNDPQIKETMGRLQVGIVAVVGCQDFDISPPTGAAPPDESGAPNWFLITSPREDVIAKLLEEETHSLIDPPVTFYTREMTFELGHYICTLQGMSPTIREESAKAVIEKHLRDTVIPDILANNSRPGISWDEIMATTENALSSLEIKIVPWKLGGDIPAPLVNIYMLTAAESIEEWFKWRDAIVTHVYTSAKYGTARGTAPPFCRGCHGVDHPVGLCTDRALPDWNGDLARENEQRNSDRNQQGYASRGGRGRGRGRSNRF